MEKRPTRLSMTIWALSKRTEVGIETIRYYERIGILPKPSRSFGGQRLYTEEYRWRVLFARRARQLGFSLDDVRTLLQLIGRRTACAKVKSITEKHIANIRQRVTELNRVKRMLRAMVGQCQGEESAACPILDSLVCAETEERVSANSGL